MGATKHQKGRCHPGKTGPSQKKKKQVHTGIEALWGQMQDRKREAASPPCSKAAPLPKKGHGKDSSFFYCRCKCLVRGVSIVGWGCWWVFLEVFLWVLGSCCTTFCSLDATFTWIQVPFSCRCKCCSCCGWQQLWQPVIMWSHDCVLGSIYIFKIQICHIMASNEYKG